MEVYIIDRPTKAQKPCPLEQMSEITFNEEDAQGVQHPHDDHWLWPTTPFIEY
jgi:hypothetical protein